MYIFVTKVMYTLGTYINGYCALKLGVFLIVVSVCKNAEICKRNRK
jgi:hypothetical protein